MALSGGEMLGMEDGSGQPVSALSILSLLERVSTIIDGIQASQQRMEERQAELESNIRGIQSDVLKLSSEHTATAGTVNKLLQKARRVSAHVKEVRTRVEKQNVRVKKVETTQDELLTRNKFRVVIYQGETEVPSVAVTKTPKVAGLAALEVEPDEYEPPADLSSDEEYMVVEEGESSRAARLKESGLKGIENIKAAFSKDNMNKTREKTRENLTKTRESLSKTGQTLGTKINTLGEKIVPPEKREKIKQSSDRLKENISKKVPSIKLKKERTVAEGQEGAEGELAVTPPKGRKANPQVTYTEVVAESKREGPISEEGATSIPVEGRMNFTVEHVKEEGRGDYP
ncbi:caveolae-associated protein 4a [Denticeps clupeoides]|uniref:Muscle-restricted coiled-coil protein n=1 Tax=Denticeps clupeoides TaxID=299321 RepID=A0AAY4AL99_9TELE|nr:caveolae-associated protein 4a-like [Denticeps clupeoides]